VDAESVSDLWRLGSYGGGSCEHGNEPSAFIYITFLTSRATRTKFLKEGEGKGPCKGKSKKKVVPVLLFN